jgi:PST family polysaccharide transporter
MALVIAPIMIVSYVIGLPYGPTGVAVAYSTVMVLWIIPVIAWSVHGTAISVRDVLLMASRPLASSIVAAVLAFTVRLLYGQSLAPLPRLALENGVLFTTFAAMLLFATGQKTFYMDLFRLLRSRSAAEDSSVVSAS